MIFIKYEIKDLKLGNIVWACAFSLQDNKEGMHLFTKPVKGMMTLGNTEDYNDKLTKQVGYPRLSYFVPFKLRSNQSSYEDLAWSKAVAISARKYASTEQEAVDRYNSMIESQISCFKNKIRELEDAKVI